MRFLLSTLVLCTVLSSGVAQAAPKGCPPGLAKKTVPCVPPGQAKKARAKAPVYAPEYRRGDVIRRGDFVVIRYPERYGLNRNGTYYESGGYVFRVDRETREVLDLIGAAGAVLD